MQCRRTEVKLAMHGLTIDEHYHWPKAITVNTLFRQ